MGGKILKLKSEELVEVGIETANQNATIRMYRNGVTIDDICQYLNVTKEKISHWISEANLTTTK